MGLDLSDLTGIDVNELTPEQLVAYDGAAEGVNEFFAKVKTRINDLVEQGQEVSDGKFQYVLQPGRGSNDWSKPEEEIVKMLKARRLKNADIYPAKLITVSALMNSDLLTKEQKDKIQKGYVEYTAGKKRPVRVEVQKQTVENMFGDIANQETTVSFF